MNPALPVNFATVGDVLNDHRLAGVVEGKQDAKITGSKSVLTGPSFHCHHVPLAKFDETRHRGEDSLPVLGMNPIAGPDSRLGPDVTPGHARSSQRRSTSSCDNRGSPARIDAFAPSMARSSSSVSGSSDTGAFIRARVTGSSLGAVGGMTSQVWSGAASRATAGGRNGGNASFSKGER